MRELIVDLRREVHDGFADISRVLGVILARLDALEKPKVAKVIFDQSGRPPTEGANGPQR